MKLADHIVTRSITMVMLLVPDYDEEISFFVKVLRFSSVEDKPLGD